MHLGQLLFPLFALALDLPETFFDDKVSLSFLPPLAASALTSFFFQTTKPAAIMRLLHYPPQSPSVVDANDKVIGIGAHTEYVIPFRSPPANFNIHRHFLLAMR